MVTLNYVSATSIRNWKFIKVTDTFDENNAVVATFSVHWYLFVFACQSITFPRSLNKSTQILTKWYEIDSQLQKANFSRVNFLFNLPRMQLKYLNMLLLIFGMSNCNYSPVTIYLPLLLFLGTSLIVEYALLDVPVAMCAVYTELSSVRWYDWQCWIHYNFQLMKKVSQMPIIFLRIDVTRLVRLVHTMIWRWIHVRNYFQS